MEKKLDIKAIVIIVLGLALILSLVFRSSPIINNHQSEVDKLHAQNKTLLNQNDSLEKENIKINFAIDSIEHLITINNDKINQTQSEIDKLNNKRHEIPNYINTLSADSVSSAFTKYLNQRTKSKNTH